MRPQTCVANKALVALADLYEEFTGPKSSAREYLRNPSEEFERWVNLEFGVSMDKIEHVAVAGGITKGDVRGLRLKLDNNIKDIASGKMRGNVNWYVPAAFAKRDPTIYETLTNYQRAGMKLTARRIKDENDVGGLLEDIMAESIHREITTKGNRAVNFVKSLAGQTPQQKHNAITSLKRQLITEAASGDKNAVRKLEELTENEQELIRDTHLVVVNDLLYAIEKGLGPVLNSHNTMLKNRAAAENKEFKPLLNLTLADLNNKPGVKGKEDINGNIVRVDLQKLIGKIKIKDDKGDMIRLPDNLQKALLKYIRLMDRGHDTLGHSVKAKVETLGIKASDRLTEKTLAEYKKKLLDQLIPNHEEGFFPHYVEDLRADFWAGMMPLFDRASNKYERQSGSDVTLKGAMDAIDGYISKHLEKRSAQKEFEYSPNFLMSINEYLNDVNRFNFISHIDMYQAQAIKSIEKTYKDTDGGLEGYARGVTEYIMDMHETATGRSEVDNPNMRNMLRIALGYEFISKMGLNIRGAAKNWTQRLLDNIQFSRESIRKSKEWWEGEGGDLIAVGYGQAADPAIIMKDLGIGFAKGMSPELMETQGMGGQEVKVAKFNEESGKIEFTPVSKLGKVAGWVGMLGSKAAVMHRLVENNNRTRTFKIGYYQIWKWLNTPEFFRQQEAAGISTNEAKRIIHKSAENYAIRMVIAHHFDYSDFSKAPILTGPIGRTLGQFQHFAFSFNEKSWDIVRKAKNDIMEGEIQGENAWRAYKYGMI
mgnify:CR=1 FL=1